MILPWVRVKNLGSYLLSQVTRQLIQDWFCYYEQQLLLLETFVDPRFFQGTVYKAAGWVHVGSTLGFTRQGSFYRYHGYPKEVYLCPLRADFRSIIGCQQRPYPKPSTAPVERSTDPMLLERVGWDPSIAARLSIDPEDVSKLTQRLVRFVQKFASCFQKKEQIFNALVYLKGLASDLNAKSVEPIAIKILGEEKVRAMQHFITGSTWDADKVLDKSKEELAEDISGDDGMFTLDSSEFPKKGKDSAGVERQYCGNLGKVENCQSGVFLGYASSKGYALLNRKLYMPEIWFTDEYAERREKTQVPEDLTFQTKVQIAWEMLEKTVKSGAFAGRWVGMDSYFGKNTALRDAIGEKYYYFADIHSNTLVWLERPEISLSPYKGRGPYPKKKRPLTDPVPVSKIAKDPTLPWETVSMGEGAKGPITAEVVRLRVIEHRDGMPGPEYWLFLRKNANGEIKYAFCNAPEDIPMEELIRASSMRWSIEQLFQEGKSYLGMDHYEVRSYPGWHRHMTLVFLIMHFLLGVRREFGGKKLYNAAIGLPAFNSISNRRPGKHQKNDQDCLDQHLFLGIGSRQSCCAAAPADG
ncbi:MAG: IS701 family transposase [Dethiobacter sp.]|nr:MAG: IS701 family transposase [Dethiobacter sp.]